MLAILNRLYHVDADTLGWWLCERQLPSGGLNGNAVTCAFCDLEFRLVHVKGNLGDGVA